MPARSISALSTVACSSLRRPFRRGGQRLYLAAQSQPRGLDGITRRSARATLSGSRHGLCGRYTTSARSSRANRCVKGSSGRLTANTVSRSPSRSSSISSLATNVSEIRG